MVKISLIFCLFMIWSHNSACAQDYKIIVNKSNPVETLSEQELSYLLLKKETCWQNGQIVQPVDLQPDNKIRKKLTQSVHRRSVNSVRVYWQKQIFSGRLLPPVEKLNEQEVIAFIKTNQGAIGYVSAHTDVTDVKVVFVNK